MALRPQFLESFAVYRKSGLPLVACLVVFAAAGALIAGYGVAFVVLLLAAGYLAALATDLPTAFVATGAVLIFQFSMMSLIEPDSVLQRPLGLVDDFMIVSLAVAAPIHGRGRRVLSTTGAAVLGAAASAVLLGSVAAFLNGNRGITHLMDAVALSKGFLVFFAALHLRVTPDRLKAWLRRATWVALGLAVFGVADLLFPTFLRQILPLAGPITYRGTFRCFMSVFPNEGMSGWFFAFAACMPLAGFLVTNRRPDLIASVVLLLSSFLSIRRKPVAGMAIALAFYFLVHGKGHVRLRVAVAAVLLIVVVAPMAGGPIVGTFHDAWTGYVTPVDPMEIARNALYIGAWQIARDHFPLGAGLGLYGGAASIVEYSPFYVKYGLDRVHGLTDQGPSFASDAFWPHILGALGWLGALLYLAALVLPVRAISRGLRDETRPEPLRIALVAALLAGIEALAEAVAAPVFETSLPCFAVFGLAGLAMAGLRDDGRDEA